MWVFLPRRGFFSVVMAKDPKTDKTIAGKVTVRARVRKHIASLVQLLKRVGCSTKVIATPTADYPFRIVIPASWWADFIAEEAERIDYTNAKNAAHDAKDRVGNPFVRAMGDVWFVMRRIEDDRENNA